MYIKRTFFLLFFFFSNIYLNAQCAMCKAVVEANLESGSTKGAGLNDGILYLMAIPYIVILFFSIIYYFQKRKIIES